MTIRGIICILVELFFLIVSLGTGIRELLVVAICLGAVIVYSFISVLLSVLTLTARTNIDKKELNRKETVCLTLTLNGVVLLPVTCFVTVYPPGAKYWQKHKRHRHAFSLTPSLILTREYAFNLICSHRGYYTAGLRTLRLRDLFGLFSVPIIRSRKEEMKNPLTVFPRVYRLQSEEEKVAIAEGNASTQIKSASQGELLGDSRQYQSGDPLNRINWKLSARTRELYTRQFEVQENPQVLIILDAACKSENVSRIADIACETAASLANHYVDSNRSVRFVTVRSKSYVENEDMWVKNDRDVYVILHQLVGITFYNDETPLELWQLEDIDFRSTSTIRVITDNPSLELLNMMGDIISRDGMADCFIPVGDETIDETTIPSNDRISPVFIYRPSQITEKLGDVL